MSRSLDTNQVRSSTWPSLPYHEWKDTLETIHMWTQIVGKIRLSRAPMTNHYWHVVLYVTPWGLTTSPVPFDGRTIEFVFDFHRHLLDIRTSDAIEETLPLAGSSVADFYHRVLATLERIGSAVRIYPRPNEVERAIPFAEDNEHHTYVEEHAQRFAQVISEVDRVLKEFRGGFLGKASPVHFFWGGFDMAVTRFSGRTAPPHPGGVLNLPDYVAREAYSHEVSSAGFWPGGGILPEPVFYSYAYPEPPDFATARVGPESASYHPTLKEFVLPYEQVRTAPRPDALVMEFLQTTYNAAADLAKWDRQRLERQ